MIRNSEAMRRLVRSNMPFFAAAWDGKVYARYLPWGPVFKWDKNMMIPTPLQGDDLEWFFRAEEESDC